MDKQNKTPDFIEFRDSIFEKAYYQALSEYSSWEKYKREQWKALLFYGKEDLLDLTLCLLSSSRRIKYPIPALDLAAYTSKKFGLDTLLVNIPVNGITFNERTGESDPIQYLSLNIKFGATCKWRLHLGAHILARCYFLSDNPRKYFHQLIQNMIPPHDIIVAADRELHRIINHQCPYENEAETYTGLGGMLLYEGLKKDEVVNFFYKEKSPSEDVKNLLEAEAKIEKDICEIAQKIPIHRNSPKTD